MGNLGKGEMRPTTDLNKFVNKIWEKYTYCVSTQKFRLFISTCEKWKRKQKCCVYIFIQKFLFFSLLFFIGLLLCTCLCRVSCCWQSKDGQLSHCLVVRWLFVCHCVCSELAHALGEGSCPAACAGAVIDTPPDTPPGSDWLFWFECGGFF